LSEGEEGMEGGREEAMATCEEFLSYKVPTLLSCELEGNVRRCEV